MVRDSFSERYGHVDIKSIQHESMDSDLRMRLVNFSNEFIGKYGNTREFLDDTSKDFLMIDIGMNPSHFKSHIRRIILEDEWHKVYSLIEYITPRLDSYAIGKYRCNSIPEELNYILEKEKSGYRYLDEYIVPITNETELTSLQKSMNSKYDSVNRHIEKALIHYSNKISPDYENSIKESISAVESISCIIVGKDSAILTSALDRLKSKGVSIHKAQIEAFKKLYGYTSDENGIRHAGIDFKNAKHEDAKFMLVSCSAFVNYLIEKYEAVHSKV